MCPPFHERVFEKKRDEEEMKMKMKMRERERERSSLVALFSSSVFSQGDKKKISLSALSPQIQSRRNNNPPKSLFLRVVNIYRVVSTQYNYECDSRKERKKEELQRESPSAESSRAKEKNQHHFGHQEAGEKSQKRERR